MNRDFSFRGFYSQLRNIDLLDLSLRLTLIDLVLKPVGDIKIRFFILTLACIGLIFPAQLRNPYLWTGLALFLGTRLILSWPFSDNHAYLLFYWCRAVAICLYTADAKKYLTVNARYLIGLAFLFATIWKLILSPDFSDGTFFSVNMLTDPRFEDFTKLVVGLSDGKYNELYQFVSQHVDGRLMGNIGTPQIPEKLFLVSSFLTYYTLIIESLVAAAFLWPLNRGLSKYRDYILLFFCITVYSVATVEGFGWLLLAMGSVQVYEHRYRTRVLYILVFIIIIFYSRVPVSEVLLEHFR